jgi:hypothetical protein
MESDLDVATGRGARAHELLSNELLAEAFKTLEDAYTTAWRSTGFSESK